jgi:TackOD1 domain-containing protein
MTKNRADASESSATPLSQIANDEKKLRRKHLPIAGDDDTDQDTDSGVLAILSLLSDSSNEGKELRPYLKPEYGGIVYELSSGFEVSYEKLRQSEKKGLIQGSGFLAFTACPKCENLNLQTQMFCPECRSQALLKSDLIIHYECQCTGPVEEFQSNIRNGYYCQKCRKELKRVGIDYGNPGIGFKCSSCEKVFQFPLVLSRCDYGHSSGVDELDLRSYPKYTLGRNAKGLSTLLVECRNLKDELEKKSLKVKVLATLKGASGATHVAPLLLTKPSQDSNEQIAIELVNDESNFEKTVLQLLLKSADLQSVKMIIVYKGPLTSIDHIKAVVNPQKVKVLLLADPAQLPDQIIKEVTVW